MFKKALNGVVAGSVFIGNLALADGNHTTEHSTQTGMSTPIQVTYDYAGLINHLVENGNKALCSKGKDVSAVDTRTPIEVAVLDRGELNLVTSGINPTLMSSKELQKYGFHKPATVRAVINTHENAAAFVTKLNEKRRVDGCPKPEKSAESKG